MAGRIVTLAQQKGGAGKTTLAVHLAVAWAKLGRRVATLDIDPQGSLSAWAAVRNGRKAGPDGSAAVTHAQVAGWRLEAEVRRLAQAHDLVVVDSPPHMETETRLAVRVADLVLVPVQPTPMDVWATRPTLGLAKDEGRRVLIVLNRVPPRGTLAAAMTAEIAALGAAVARTPVGNRASLAASLLRGRAIVEEQRPGKAGEEIEALAVEVLALLQ
ncbi:MAG: ParA family protein [Alphaproteobacteria bacterium]|nr:ParA family protein [Alphaproteobacteria bacterium]